MDISKPDIGRQIYRTRKRCELSQRELAHLLGVTQAAVSRWETGARIPRLPMLRRLTQAMRPRCLLDIK